MKASKAGLGSRTGTTMASMITAGLEAKMVGALSLAYVGTDSSGSCSALTFS